MSHPHLPADAPDEFAYLATRPLHIGDVRAFNAGDHVPASTVKEQGWSTTGKDADVVKVGTKAAEQAATPPSTPPGGQA